MRNKTNKVPAELAGRVPSLDGLRAVSIFMVVISHAAYSCQSPSIPGAAYFLYIFNGDLGVRIFFVISGFIISLLLLKEEDQNGSISLGNFYVRRAFRILPVYFSFLAVMIVIKFVYHVAIAPNEFIAAFTFTTGWWKESTWLLGHTWSLSVEEQFYLFWPLSILLIKGKRNRFLLVAVLLLVFPVLRVLVYLFADGRFQFTFLRHGDSILFGCLMSFILFYKGEHLQSRLVNKVWAARLFAIGMIAIFNWWATTGRMGWMTVPFLVTVQSLLIAWLMAGFIFYRDWIFKLLNARLMIFLGTISYSWYLWQQLFLFECDRFFGGVFFSFPVNVICSFAMACLSYYTIEKGFLYLRNRTLLKHS